MTMIIMIVIFIIQLGVGTFKSSSYEKAASEGGCRVVPNLPSLKGAARESSLVQWVLSQKASFPYFSESLGRGKPSIYPGD